MGTERTSCTPLAFAQFTRIRKTQDLKELRPSKRCSPFRTPSQASCTTSSALARLFTYIVATRSIAPW
jgi:hypothetical protein